MVQVAALRDMWREERDLHQMRDNTVTEAGSAPDLKPAGESTKGVKHHRRNTRA